MTSIGKGAYLFIQKHTRILVKYFKREKNPTTKTRPLPILVKSTFHFDWLMPCGTHYELWQVYSYASGICCSFFDVIKSCNSTI